MKFDSEQQRAFILELFRQCNFPGATLDMAYQVKQAVLTGKVAAPPTVLSPAPVQSPDPGAPLDLSRASDDF